MTWKQIEANCSESVTFGSHTVDHIRLSLVEEDIARDQLARSKRDIELHTGKPCQAIGYPSGNITDEVVDLARTCGYSCGVTTIPGLNSIGDDVMSLRRFHMPWNANEAELLFMVSSIWNRRR